MTKKKITILLSSILAGVGLVGATFAAWAVTDNANPFGIKISPGNISADTYDTLVLDWGDRTEFTNISGLELGESNAVYLPLGVKAQSTSGAQGGNLSISLEDQTVHAALAPKLIDHLNVKVYKNRTGTSPANYVYDQEVATLALNGGAEPTPVISANADIETPANGSEQKLYFKVYIDATGLDVNKYNQMKSDIVYLKLDWNKPSGMTDLVTGAYTVYYTPLGSYVPKIYAWNSETLIPNAEYPGVAMTLVQGSTNLYSYELNPDFNKIIFSENGDTTPAHKVGDLDVPTAANKAAGQVYYNGSAWAKVPEVTEMTYWLIGSMNGWASGTANYQFEKDTEHAGRYTLSVTTTAADQQMKVIDGDNVTFWGEFTKGASGDTNVFTLGIPNTYVLEFYPNGGVGGNSGTYLGVVGA